MGKRFLILLIAIFLNNILPAQNSYSPTDDFSEKKVNEYLEKYGMPVAKLSDKIVLKGAANKVGLFYTYSTIKNLSELYELKLQQESLPVVDYYEKSQKIVNNLVIETAAYSAMLMGVPFVGILKAAYTVSNDLVDWFKMESDKTFLNTQLMYYINFIELGVSPDPYMDGYVDNYGYLLRPNGTSYLSVSNPSDKMLFSAENVKSWVTANYKALKIQKEIEIARKKNVEELYEYLSKLQGILESYQTGELTDLLITGDYNIIVGNNGDETILNYKLIRKEFGITIYSTEPVNINPHSHYPIGIDPKTISYFNYVQFEVMDEIITLDLSEQEIPFLPFMNVFYDDTYLYSRYAPATMKISYTVFTNGDDNNFQTTIDFGDGTQSNIIQSNNGANSYFRIENEHVYSNPGNYKVVIITQDEYGYTKEISHDFLLQNPIQPGYPLNSDDIIFPDSTISFTADSIKCIFPDAQMKYYWDFNYNGMEFKTDKTGKNVEVIFDIDPSIFVTRNYEERIVCLVSELFKNDYFIRDTIIQTIRISNPISALLTSREDYKNIMLDIASFPFSIEFDGSESFSHIGNSVKHYWYINGDLITQGPIFNYPITKFGKYVLTLKVTDGKYYKSVSETIIVGSIVPYDPNTSIQYIEYFFNEDPGYGNGKQVFFETASILKSDFNIDLNDLPIGLNRLFFRVKDDKGKWSNMQSMPVYVQNFSQTAQINKVEYYFDSVGSAGDINQFSINQAENIELSEKIGLSELTDGLHRINFRAKDTNNKWSNMQSMSIYVQKSDEISQISEIEYYFDSLNYAGALNKLSFDQAENIELSENIGLSELTDGLHRIYFRAKDVSGCWSTIHGKSIYINNDSKLRPEIVKLEYFIGEDPGIDFGKPITFIPQNEVTINSNIPLVTLSEGEYNIYFRAKDSFGKWSFPVVSSFFIEENVFKVALQTGWNIFSSPICPGSQDMPGLFQPLIENGSLVKIQDESGNSFENWGIFGSWKNNIGSISVTEGYKIKVNRNDTLEVSGTPVKYPYAIPLKAGWNIAGYPQLTDFSGMNLVQQLADKGTLIKVQDEGGNSIENWGIFGSWQNNIGNFMAGEGYKIKVSADDTLWIYENYPKSSVLLPEIIATSHFAPVFNGNGMDHMNINLVGLPINILQVGDELAIFDGATCVGAVTLMPHHLHSQTVSIVTSATDNSGMPGFFEGNPFVLKLWNSENKQEFQLEPEIVKGTSTFIRNETTVASLEKYATTGLDGLFASEQPEINCYPNPFSDEITVEINLFNETGVHIEVLNQLGQQVKNLAVGEQLNRGVHRLIWDGTNAGNGRITSGIYIVRLKIDEVVYYRKVIYSK